MMIAGVGVFGLIVFLKEIMRQGRVQEAIDVDV